MFTFFTFHFRVVFHLSFFFRLFSFFSYPLFRIFTPKWRGWRWWGIFSSIYRNQTTSGTPLTWDFPPLLLWTHLLPWIRPQLIFEYKFELAEKFDSKVISRNQNMLKKCFFVKLEQNNGLFLLILDFIIYPHSIFWSSVPLNAAKKIISFRIFNFLGHICRICRMILYVYWEYSEWFCSYTENIGMNLFVYRTKKLWNESVHILRYAEQIQTYCILSICRMHKKSNILANF